MVQVLLQQHKVEVVQEAVALGVIQQELLVLRTLVVVAEVLAKQMVPLVEKV